MFFVKLLPGSLMAFVIVVITTPWMQHWHSALVNQVADLLPGSDEPVKYRIDPEIGSPGELWVKWPNGRVTRLDAFRNGRSQVDFLDDLGLSFDGLPSLWASLGHTLSPIVYENRSGVWRPAVADYKQLVYRSNGVAAVDQVIQREFQNADIRFDRIGAGFLSIPVDPYGGVYLLIKRAPDAMPAQLGDLSVVVVSQFDALTEQFLAETWAIDNQQWAITHGFMLLAATLALFCPWLVIGRFQRQWLVVLCLLAVNVMGFVFAFWQWQWVYPVILPMISPFLAWAWSHRLTAKQLEIQSWQHKHLLVTDLWVGHLLDEGKPEAAFRHLKEVQAEGQPYSPIWQKVGKGFERKRQFDRSIECYQSILRSNKSDVEARNKVRQLKDVVDGSKTMAISQSGGELPVGQVDNLSLGRYQISKELGRGAMGVVYEAEDPKIHRKVALKVVHLKNLGIDEVDQVKQRFFREAQAAGKLNHPNIVTVYDVGEEHDVAYIAMDLLVGQPLSALVNQKPIQILQQVVWIAQAAEALGYAHENEVIHRDVKPANMIIEQKSNRLKLTDFGVARIAGVQQTQTGIVLGSPSYMSPEQIRGEKLTGSTDIFSLGVTLYQCITGELPFAGDTLPALAYSITQSKQESPRNVNSEVPVSLVRIVNKALQKDPKERFQTADDFAKALNKWVKDHS